MSPGSREIGALPHQHRQHSGDHLVFKGGERLRSPAGGEQRSLFSTDAQGRIYRMGQDRTLTLLVQTNEGETTRLLPSNDFIVAATSTSGKLLTRWWTSG